MRLVGGIENKKEVDHSRRREAGGRGALLTSTSIEIQ